MTQLTREERAALTGQVAYILSRCEQDRSWQDVLVDAYCEFMPEADKTQGQLVAQHILDTMSEFETAYDLSRSQYENFATYYLDSEARAKAKAFAAKASMTDDDMKKVEETIKESWSNSSRLRSGYGDNAFRSLSTLVLYTMAVKGQLNHVPKYVSIRQVTHIVCFEDSMGQLMDDVEKGYIEIEQYRTRRNALWQILKFGLVAGFALLGGGAVVISLTEEQIMGAIVSGVTAIFGIALCLGPLDDTMQKMTENEDIPIREDSIPVYSKADDILAAYDGNHRADDFIDIGFMENYQEQETPTIPIEEI